MQGPKRPQHSSSWALYVRSESSSQLSAEVLSRRPSVFGKANLAVMPQLRQRALVKQGGNMFWVGARVVPTLVDERVEGLSPEKSASR